MKPTARCITRGMLPTLLMAVACTGDRSQPGTHVVDSAGVQVVTNLQETVRTNLVEDLRLDQAGGLDATPFSDIGAVGVDGTGHLFVADRQASTIYVFNDEGEFVRSIGREGTDPGEFAPLSRIWVGADELLALGGGSGPPILSLFSSNGEFIVSRPTATRYGARITPMGQGDGFWTIQLREPTDVRSLEPGTVHVDSIGIARFRPADGTLYQPFLYFPGAAEIVAPLGQNTAAPLFNPVPATAVDSRGRIYRTSGDRYAIEVFDSDGALLRRFGRERTSGEIRQEWLDAYVGSVQAHYRTVPASRRRTQELRRFTEDRVHLMHVDAVPPTDRLLVAPDGACWVERRDLAEEPWRRELHAVIGTGDVVPLSSIWDVFDPSGRYVTTAELPVGFQPHHVTERGVVGVLVSDSGLEHVVRYRLTDSD